MYLTVSLPDLSPTQRCKSCPPLVAPDSSWACSAYFLFSETYLPLPRLCSGQMLDTWITGTLPPVWTSLPEWSGWHADVAVSPLPLPKYEVSKSPTALWGKCRHPAWLARLWVNGRSSCVLHTAHALVHPSISGHLSPGATPGWRRSSRGRDRQLKGELAQGRWRYSSPPLSSECTPHLNHTPFPWEPFSGAQP